MDVSDISKIVAKKKWLYTREREKKNVEAKTKFANTVLFAIDGQNCESIVYRIYKKHLFALAKRKLLYYKCKTLS